MLVPTKHENLNINILVMGSKVLKKVNKRSIHIETLIKDLRTEDSNCDINIVYNVLTFLDLIDAIDVTDNYVRVKK